MMLFLSGNVRPKRFADEEKAKIANGVGYCAINEPKNNLKRYIFFNKKQELYPLYLIPRYRVF